MFEVSATGRRGITMAGHLANLKNILDNNFQDEKHNVPKIPRALGAHSTCKFSVLLASIRLIVQSIIGICY